MTALAVIDQKNKKVSDIELTSATADKVNKAVLYYALKGERNNLRHGTVQVKGRSDVNRTNKKVFKQKGTGNARHGARSANIFVGGGNVHGPQPRSYFEHLNKKMKTVSYREMFKSLIQANALKVVSAFSFEKPSTKLAAGFLKTVGVAKATLLISNDENVNVVRSFRNIANINVLPEQNLNVYDLARFENVIVTEPVFARLKERFGL